MKKSNDPVNIEDFENQLARQAIRRVPDSWRGEILAAAGSGIAAISLWSGIKSTLKIMAWTKLKMVTVAGVIAILVVGGTTVAYHDFSPAGRNSHFTFAGYHTPEASMQSLIWSASQGDLDKIAEASTQDVMDEFKAAMAGKSKEEIKRGNQEWAAAMKGYQITQKDVISDDEVHLHIHAPPSDAALRTGKTVIIMKKFGDEWKMAGNVK